MKTIRSAGAVLILAGMIFAVFAALTQPVPQPEPAGWNETPSASQLAADTAEARWYFTCGGDSRHRHFLRGKTHIWNLKDVFRRDGREYHRGVWKTFDWGREVVTARDSRTYDCTGR